MPEEDEMLTAGDKSLATTSFPLEAGALLLVSNLTTKWSSPLLIIALSRIGAVVDSWSEFSLHITDLTLMSAVF